MIKTLLWDLDGTLLSMDQQEFITHYFRGLVQKMAPHGYDPQQLPQLIWKWVRAMYGNDGSLTNEKLFWQEAEKDCGQKILDDYHLFEEYYNEEFQNIGRLCIPDPEKIKLVREWKEQYQQVLATNPLFPTIATRSRIRWAGLDPEDFELITTYENSHYTKPSPDYFREVLHSIGARPEECLMIGNDVQEDGGALKAGIPLFILDEFLINPDQKSLDGIPHGSLEDLRTFLKEHNDRKR